MAVKGDGTGREGLRAAITAPRDPGCLLADLGLRVIEGVAGPLDGLVLADASIGGP
ncbi:hypothetical protein CFIICLFH_2245 [Methylobacterium goesingense]|uniref:Uncharacterized protein n=1 Tax=Methylobacterium goesingense TaxID=243690 RepID=A0ABV2L322_9HYPH|nr:hypothetical protein CFIICLFH_2245 [Methylobacterium goesingense]